MIWSDSRGHRLCQGAQCHVEMEWGGGGGGGGGGMWLFLSLAPDSSAHSCSAHSCTHTGAYKQTQACTFKKVHPYLHIHTHTSQWHSNCNEAWRKWHNIQYYLQCLNLERMCFFSHCCTMNILIFLPLICLEAFAYCILNCSPVHIKMHSFCGYWEQFETLWDGLEISSLVHIFACVFHVPFRF